MFEVPVPQGDQDVHRAPLLHLRDEGGRHGEAAREVEEQRYVGRVGRLERNRSTVATCSHERRDIRHWARQQLVLFDDDPEAGVEVPLTRRANVDVNASRVLLYPIAPRPPLLPFPVARLALNGLWGGDDANLEGRVRHSGLRGGLGLMGLTTPHFRQPG